MQWIMEFLYQFISIFEKSGYWGIFFLMALESTLIPIPSELIVPPAAYLAYKGELSLSGVIFSGTLGSLAGSLLNYFVALKLGRPATLYFIKKYGKYLLISEKSFYKVENFWNIHGHISIFTGRLIPGFRHIISIFAGLAKMNLFFFSFFTTLGAGIWCSFLAFCGYFLGQNQALLKEILQKGSYGIIVFCIVLIFFYAWFKYKRR